MMHRLHHREGPELIELGLPIISEAWPTALPEHLQAFWDYCQGLKDPQTGHFSRKLFSPCDVPELLTGIQIIETERTEADAWRFRWRLSGTDMRKYYGLDTTGRYIDDVFPSHVMREIQRMYGKALDKNQPHYMSARQAMAGLSLYRYERIVVPFHKDNDQVQLIGYWHWYPESSLHLPEQSPPD